MIKEKTVFILGAGASKSYGFPTGIELKEEICNLLENDLEHKVKYNSGQINFFKIDRIIEEATSFTIEQFKIFIDYLKNSPLYSIDQFLNHGQEFHTIGKTAIAIIISLREKEENLKSSDDDWMTYLFNIMVEDCIPYNFESNYTYFITFNYDRSLELFFHNSLKNTFRINDEEAIGIVNKLRIYHVHGRIGNLLYENKNLYNSYNPILNDNTSLINLSDEIKIIYESIDTERLANYIISAFNEVKRVYFLGFGFDKFNINRLAINKFENLRNAHVEGTTLNISERELERINNNLKFFKVRNNDMKCLEFLKKVAYLD